MYLKFVKMFTLKAKFTENQMLLISYINYVKIKKKYISVYLLCYHFTLPKLSFALPKYKVEKKV